LLPSDHPSRSVNSNIADPPVSNLLPIFQAGQREFKVRRSRYEGSRPFQTTYAGAFNGYSKTREGAIMAAMRHVVKDGYNRATITDRVRDVDVAWVTVNKDRTSATVQVAKALKVIE